MARLGLAHVSVRAAQLPWARAACRAAAAPPLPVRRLSARGLGLGGQNPTSPQPCCQPRFARAAPGEERKLQVRGLFYGIGHMPNSGIVAGQVELDAAGYVKAPPPPPPIPPRRPWRRVPINYHNPNPILLHRVSLPAGFGHPPARPGQVALDAVGLPEGAPAAAAPHGAATVPARLPPRGRAGRCGAFVRAHAQAHNRCACVPASIRSGRPTQRSWPALR